jgi:membrane protease YdiL (CAAX protease family)
MTTVVSAVVAGVGVLLAGNLPWAVLLAPLNLRVLPSVPWAIAPMGAYLWFYWRFIDGRSGPPHSAAFRHASLRANRLSAPVWSMSLLTGLVGFAALGALLLLMARLVAMPASAPLVAPAGMPPLTAFLLLVMSSVVAGVTEEAGFRGYMQGPIEHRYGLTAGIVVNGTMFGLLHFPNHPDAVVSMLPYYIAVTAVYGSLVWATDSILPAVALHSGGDVWSLARLWLTGRPEWVLSETPRAAVWTTGLDGPFLMAAGALVFLAAVFAVLCLKLHQFDAVAVLSTDAV